MKRYEKYKKVDLPWLEEVPEHWEIAKLKDLGFFSASGIDKKIIETETPIKIVNYTDVYGNKSYVLKNKNYMIVTTSKEKKKRHNIKKGDMIFTPSSETIDDIGVSAVAMEDLENTSYSYHVLRFRFNKSINLRFKKYICNNNIVLNYFSSEAKGTTRQILNRDKFKMADIILPPKSEQEKIAAFLDYKISRIDRAIELEEKKKEKLDIVKNSYIKKLVHYGIYEDELKLNDNYVFKVIPKHWERRYLSQISKENKVKNSGMINDNLLSLSYGKVIEKDINTTDGLLPASFESYQILEPGMIVLRLTDLQNDHKSLRVGICKNKGIITSAYVGLKLSDEVIPEYVYYLLHSYDICKGFYGMGGGVRQSLNYTGLSKMELPLPPKEEQSIIVSKILSFTNVVEGELKYIDKKIEKLKSLKQSLISEVVTGQIDVRDFEIPKEVE